MVKPMTAVARLRNAAVSHAIAVLTHARQGEWPGRAVLSGGTALASPRRTSARARRALPPWGRCSPAARRTSFQEERARARPRTAVAAARGHVPRGSHCSGEPHHCDGKPRHCDGSLESLMRWPRDHRGRARKVLPPAHHRRPPLRHLDGEPEACGSKGNRPIPWPRHCSRRAQTLRPRPKDTAACARDSRLLTLLAALGLLVDGVWRRRGRGGGDGVVLRIGRRGDRVLGSSRELGQLGLRGAA
jgi:hypothetical protein